MPTLYEIFFWVSALAAVATFCVRGLVNAERALYVSDYELDRLNGAKY